MSNILLHLSNTDIRYDSRILKELRALEVLNKYARVAIGVELDEGASVSDETLRAQIVTVRLFTKLFKVLPRVLRYSLNIIELTVVFFLRGFVLRPVIVHCHDTLVLPVGVLIKLATGCKLVYDAHELESIKNGQTRILSKCTLLIEKLCWRWVDLQVSVSDSILAWYRDNLGLKEHVLVLNSPEIVNRQDFSSGTIGSKRYFHKLYGIPDDKLVFVYIGILGQGRGIKLELDAFTTPTIDAHLVFVGYGVLSSYIQSYCDRYPNIHLHKSVPHAQVVMLVRNADVGLCLIEKTSLSSYYCLPNKLFEYCFAGLHVLGSDFPEIRKVVDQYSLGTCCAVEPKRVREAIQFLIEHRPTRVDTDLSVLSWGAQAERLIHSYCKLLGIEY